MTTDQTTKATDSEKSSAKRRKLRRDGLRRPWPAYVALIPTFALLLLFSYYPAANGLFRSLFEWRPGFESPWEGLGNYQQMLADEYWWRSFANIGLMFVFHVTFGWLLPLIAAELLITLPNLRTRNIYRILLIVPMAFPAVVEVLLWGFIYHPNDGLLNRALIGLGLESWTHNWLGDTRFALLSLMMINFPWIASLPFLIFVSALQNIPREIFEAATLDGAGRVRRFISIDLPMLVTQMRLLFVLGVIGILQYGVPAALLTGGGPGFATQVPVLYMLNIAFTQADWGYAATLCATIFLLIVAFSSLAVVLRRRESSGQSAPGLVGRIGRAVAWIFTLPSALAEFVAGVVHPWLARLPKPSAKTQHRLKQLRIAMVHGSLALMIAVGIFPHTFMLISSFKTAEQFNESYWLPAFPLSFDNYVLAWEQISRYMLNTIVVAAFVIVGVLLLGTVTSFVLGRLDIRGRLVMFGAISILMMVPGIAMLIPLFILSRDLGLLNSLWVLIIPGIAHGLVLATVLIRTYVTQMPREIFYAAVVDGATAPRIYWNIMVPLARPMIGTVALLTVISTWNDFFWPLLTINNDELRVVSIGLAFFQGQNATSYGPLFAGYIIASIPLLVLFTFFSKYFLGGLSGGLSVEDY